MVKNKKREIKIHVKWKDDKSYTGFVAFMITPERKQVQKATSPLSESPEDIEIGFQKILEKADQLKADMHKAFSGWRVNIIKERTGIATINKQRERAKNWNAKRGLKEPTPTVIGTRNLNQEKKIINTTNEHASDELILAFGHLGKFKALLRHAFKNHGIEKVTQIHNEFGKMIINYEKDKAEQEALELQKRKVAINILKQLQESGIDIEMLQDSKTLAMFKNQEVAKEKKTQYQMMHNGEVINWNGEGKQPLAFTLALQNGGDLKNFAIS